VPARDFPMMVMKVIEGDVLVIAWADVANCSPAEPASAGLSRHLVCDRPNRTHRSPSSPSSPLNPPRRSSPAVAWLVHKAEAIDDTALVVPAINPEPRDLDSCVAARSCCSADRTVELGTDRYWGWVISNVRLRLCGLFDNDVKQHVAAGTDAVVLCPSLQHLSQQLTLRVVGTNIFHRLDWISVAEPHQRRPNGV